MKTTIRTAAFKKGAPVAQTARAPDFESGGRRLDSFCTSILNVKEICRNYVRLV